MTTDKPEDFDVILELMKEMNMEPDVDMLKTDVERLQTDVDRLEGFDRPEMDPDNIELFGGSRNALIKQQKFSIKQQAFWAFMHRMGMAVLGGVFLVVPMLIMVLHKTLLTTLLTTCLFVFAFGLVLSYFLEDAFNVLSGTAAYAAVLSLFVGASGS